VTGWASADALTARPIKAAHFLRLRTNFPLKAKRRDLLAQAPHGQR
jgi:hypothetical protein